MLTEGVQIRRNHNVDDYTGHHACDDTDVFPVTTNKFLD